MPYRSRSTRFALRATAGLAALAFVGGLAGCSSEPERNEEGEIEEEGELSAFNIEEGDCVNDIADLTGTVSSVPVVPCDEEHGAEVFGVFDLPDGEFPAASISEDASTGCFEQYSEYYGVEATGTENVQILQPTQETWDQVDDREVVCILVGDAPTTDGAETETTEAG